MTKNNKFECFFDNQIQLRDICGSEEDKNYIDAIINKMYEYERKNALSSVKNNEESIGFAYILENYSNLERSLLYFTDRITREVLNEREYTETLIHRKFKSTFNLIGNAPKIFLYDIIEKHDKDLANFLKDHDDYIYILDEYIQYIKINWNGFEEEKEYFNKLLSDLDKYYNENTLEFISKFNCSKLDILIYLFAKNDMLDMFKRHYIMEDTTPDESNIIVSESELGDINYIDGIEFIKGMDKIIKSHNYNKTKRNEITISIGK